MREGWCARGTARGRGRPRAKCEAIEKHEAERREAEDKKHAEQIAYLTRANKLLKQQLDKFLTGAPADAKK